MLAFIVAMDQNRVIGYQNDMPWHIPRDLQYFKETTLGHTIVMGRKTFESLGRLLPNRKHVVLTRSDATFPEEVTVLHSISELLNYIEDNKEETIFIIGGGDLFSQMLPYVHRMYITEIDASFQGDVFFPTFDKNEWNVIQKKKGIKDDKNPYDYYHVIYERK